MIRLTKGQVLQMHAELIAATGGSSGIRDEALLDAALAAPFMSFGGMDLYPSLEQKAARLGYGLIKNHAMIDGNKLSAIPVENISRPLAPSGDFMCCIQGSTDKFSTAILTHLFCPHCVGKSST